MKIRDNIRTDVSFAKCGAYYIPIERLTQERKTWQWKQWLEITFAASLMLAAGLMWV